MFKSNIFSFPEILNGISKTLNIANRAIPIYKEIKPMINKAQEFLNSFKNNVLIDNENKSIKKEVKITSSDKFNNPIFFQ